MKKLRFFALGALAAGVLLAQPNAAAPAFDVASIKAAAPPTGMKMIFSGVRTDGAMMTATNITVKQLLQNAYRVKDYQIAGPEWIETLRFDLSAKIPDGASKDQVPEMLQALLAERFKLTLHREKKDHPVYALVVGKNGPKLKAAEAQTADAEAGAPQPKTDADHGGKPAFNFQAAGGDKAATEAAMTAARKGGSGMMTMRMGPGGAHIKANGTTVVSFADMISRFVDRPVVDQTGIDGRYDFDLDIAPEEIGAMKGMMVMRGGPAGAAGPPPGAGPAEIASAPEGGSIFQSIQQYGLKLEPKKAPLDMIVVDGGEKTPTEN